MLRRMTDTPQANPQHHWQGNAGERWARRQEQTDTQLAPLGRLALERLRVAKGERALDVGCGAGQTVLQLAELVGEAGHVTGLDIAPALLNRARERAKEAGLGNAELVLGNAAVQRFDEPFDLCFSRFGVMFFEDSMDGFQNLHRALRPTGRLGFVCWQGIDKNPWANLLLNAVRVIVPDQPVTDLLNPEGPGPFRFADAERLRDVLQRAGFRDIAIEPVEREIPIGGARTLEEAVDYCLDIGPASRVVADADPSLAPQFRAALLRALAPHVTERGAWLGAALYVVTARS
jgi:SAM-dependent methyltransferase